MSFLREMLITVFPEIERIEKTNAEIDAMMTKLNGEDEWLLVKGKPFVGGRRSTDVNRIREGE